MKSLKFLFLLSCFCLPLGAIAQSLVGEYEFKVPSQEGDTMIPLYVSIKADNTYALDFGGDGTVEVTGSYKAKDGKMYIQDGEGSECTGTGVYKYEATAESLTMTRVSDECENRGGPEGVMTMTRR